MIPHKFENCEKISDDLKKVYTSHIQKKYSTIEQDIINSNSVVIIKRVTPIAAKFSIYLENATPQLLEKFKAL